MLSLFVNFGGFNVNYPIGFKWGGADIGRIINYLIYYAFPLAGLFVLFFIINGGFDLLTSAGDPKKIEVGKQKITAALVGALIIFASFWIYNVIIFMLGIKN